MSNTITIGSSVLYNHKHGDWSAIVEDIYPEYDEVMASITFDGVVVPASHLCGIQGPDGWTNTYCVTISELQSRPEEHTDAEKRQKWVAKVAEYKAAQSTFHEAQLAMERQRFSHVTPGMPVTWESKTDKFKGSVVSVEKSGLAAYVKGTADGIEYTTRIMMKRLTFI